jgi:ACR3 family arsenite efflux pump ArsB
MISSLDVRPIFQIWLFLHLMVGLFPPLVAFFIHKGGNLSSRHWVVGLGILAAIIYLTMDGWIMVLAQERIETIFSFWMRRCLVTSGLVLGFSTIIALVVFGQARGKQNENPHRENG